jgi:hypothetical protein
MQFVAVGLDVGVGAVPVQAPTREKATGMPALLKVTLLALAGLLLALALTNPGPARRGGAQASQPEPVGAKVEHHIVAIPA